MPRLLPSRIVLRLVAGGATAIILGAAGYGLPPRMELGDGPLPAELVGMYQLEAVRPGNPTSSLMFLRLTADGRLRYQQVDLRDGDGGLAADVGPVPPGDVRWSVEHPSDRGALASVFGWPRLCVHVERGPSCTAFERDPYTGDIEYRYRGEPTLMLIHHGVVQRLVKLRTQRVHY